MSSPVDGCYGAYAGRPYKRGGGSAGDASGTGGTISGSGVVTSTVFIDIVEPNFSSPSDSLAHLNVKSPVSAVVPVSSPSEDFTERDGGSAESAYIVNELSPTLSRYCVITNTDDSMDARSSGIDIISIYSTNLQ